jgi:hypothetical protein
MAQSLFPFPSLASSARVVSVYTRARLHRGLAAAAAAWACRRYSPRHQYQAVARRPSSAARMAWRSALSALADGDLPWGPCAHPAGHANAGHQGSREKRRLGFFKLENPFWGNECEGAVYVIAGSARCAALLFWGLAGVWCLDAR